MKSNTSKYKAPTIQDLRNWSDAELTNLGWAYDRVRQATGENKMLVHPLV